MNTFSLFMHYSHQFFFLVHAENSHAFRCISLPLKPRTFNSIQTRKKKQEREIKATNPNNHCFFLQVNSCCRGKKLLTMDETVRNENVSHTTNSVKFKTVLRFFRRRKQQTCKNRNVYFNLNVVCEEDEIKKKNTIGFVVMIVGNRFNAFSTKIQFESLQPRYFASF